MGVPSFTRARNPLDDGTPGRVSGAPGLAVDHGVRWIATTTDATVAKKLSGTSSRQVWGWLRTDRMP
jgi:hypothetical protein